MCFLLSAVSLTWKMRTPFDEALVLPNINVILFMRGSLLPLYTRIYFSDEVEANNKDELLNAIEPERRETLIAQRIERPGLVEYIFDIYLQGENETVFFDM